MDYWIIIYAIDWLLFGIVAFAVLYMTVFTVASLFNRHPNVPKAKQQNRFIVLINAYKGDQYVHDTIKSVLGQSYPQRLFDITVISDQQDEMTNFRLAQYPITLLTPNFEHSSKEHSLQFAINNLPQFKIYDIVVVLDAGNVVEQDFLQQMNDAYEVAGTKAIQAHCLSKNRDTPVALLDSTFEEINNSIFRRGHITLGLPSALSPYGNAFNFNWFKDNISKVNSTDFDKGIVGLLMRQSAFIDYFDDILVFSEKSRDTKHFNKKHGRWIGLQLHSLVTNIHYLPAAILNRRYDWIDMFLQWIIVPRSIMMGIIVLMCIVMPIIYFSLALKWWGIFAFFLFLCALATPNYLVDKKWDKSFLTLPFIMLASLLGLSKDDKA
ncbi:MAG: glycosyltransferase [Prevotella sp.]|nr:glycosyltransferase [Prevotella sp.]